MKLLGFKLSEWRVLAIFGIVYIIIDVVMYIKSRRSEKKPIFSRELVNNILGGEEK